MSFYYDNGQLVRVRFKDEPEAERQHGWYNVGTRIIFGSDLTIEQVYYSA